MGPDKGILRDFFGVSCVAKKIVRETEYFAVVSLHYFDEGRFIPTVESLDEGGVVSGFAGRVTLYGSAGRGRRRNRTVGWARGD